MKIELGTANFILNGLRGNERERMIAFRRLHDDLCIPLCRRLCSVERCSDEAAKDIVQETFIKIYKAAEDGDLPQPEALFSWILIISKRIFIDKWRTEDTKQSPELREAKKNIATEFKKIEQAYSEAIKTKNQELISATLEEMVHVKRKLDAINGDRSSFAFDEALSEYSHSDNEDGSYFDSHSMAADSSTNSYDAVGINGSLGGLREKLHDCIMTALKKLSKVSAERAEALSLDFDGMSSKEIAEIINRTEQATRKFLSESRKAFRQYSEPCRSFYEVA